jgi:hypothetical protein
MLVISNEIKRKEKAVEALKRKYTSYTLSQVSCHIKLYSYLAIHCACYTTGTISVHSAVRAVIVCCDRMYATVAHHYASSVTPTLSIKVAFDFVVMRD